MKRLIAFFGSLFIVMIVATAIVGITIVWMTSSLCALVCTLITYAIVAVLSIILFLFCKFFLTDCMYLVATKKNSISAQNE